MAATKKKPAKKAVKKPAKKPAKKAAAKKPVKKAAPKKAAAKKPVKQAAPKKAAAKKPVKQTAAKKPVKKPAPKQAAPQEPEMIFTPPFDDIESDPIEVKPDPIVTADPTDDGWTDPLEDEAPTNGAPIDPYAAVATALVADLEAAAGDEAKETLALQKAIEGYATIAGGGAIAELGIPEYFAEDGSVGNPPALERVSGASEDDILRWREKLADLAG
jgi:hypothetical protein